MYLKVYSKTCLKQPHKKKTKNRFHYQLSLNAGLKFCRMLQGEHSAIEHSAILLTLLKLQFVIKIFALHIFEWRLKTGFTVLQSFIVFSHQTVRHNLSKSLKIGIIFNQHKMSRGKSLLKTTDINIDIDILYRYQYLSYFLSIH